MYIQPFWVGFITAHIAWIFIALGLGLTYNIKNKEINKKK